MLQTALAKFAAITCLILQLWGGTGLHRASICIRPPEHRTATCEKNCCKRAPVSTPDLAPLESACCLKATLPDLPIVPVSPRDLDTFAPSFELVSITSINPNLCNPAPVPRANAPPWIDSGTAASLASTRLRL